MIYKYFSYSKMTVFDHEILTLSAVENDDRMLRSKFFVVFKCPGKGGGGVRDTINCQMPGSPGLIMHHMPGGMLADGIDLHIIHTHCNKLKI